MEEARERRQPATRLVFENHLVEAETAGDAENLGKTEKTHGRDRVEEGDFGQMAKASLSLNHPPSNAPPRWPRGSRARCDDAGRHLMQHREIETERKPGDRAETARTRILVSHASFRPA